MNKKSVIDLKWGGVGSISSFNLITGSEFWIEYSFPWKDLFYSWYQKRGWSFCPSFKTKSSHYSSAEPLYLSVTHDYSLSLVKEISHLKIKCQTNFLVSVLQHYHQECKSCPPSCSHLSYYCRDANLDLHPLLWLLFMMLITSWTCTRYNMLVMSDLRHLAWDRAYFRTVIVHQDWKACMWFLTSSLYFSSTNWVVICNFMTEIF